MDSSIASWHDRCVSSFDHLCISLHHPVCDFSQQISLSGVLDQVGRFRVWARNIGAHLTGRASLDYRLRDATQLHRQVVGLLQDLDESVRDADLLLSGGGSVFEDRSSESSSSSDNGFSPGSPANNYKLKEEYSSEYSAADMEQLFQGINKTITCLFKLSIALRSPAPHDRLVKSASIDVGHFEFFDIQHVMNKFPKADRTLAERLGLAISKRRRQLIYRENHHYKLSGENNTRYPRRQTALGSLKPPQNANDAPNPDVDSLKKPKDHHLELTKAPSVEHTLSIIPSTKASTLLALDRLINLDSYSETGQTESTFSATTAGGEEVVLPPIPEVLRDGKEFECPYCYEICRIRSTSAWKRHLFKDLQPYICTFGNCAYAATLYDNVSEWFSHEVQTHRREWHCNEPTHASFHTKDEFLCHLEEKHVHSMAREQLANVVEMCEKPSSTSGIACPLCTLLPKKTLQNHMARHLEQLALFAIPRTSGSSKKGTGSVVDASSRSRSELSSIEIVEEEHEEFEDDINETSERHTDQETDDRIDDYRVPDSTDVSWDCFMPERSTTPNKREELQHWLSSSDQSPLQEALLRKRQPLTGKWFIDSSKFLDWKTGSNTLLWIYGIPGSGKTILSSLVIETLFKHCASNSSFAIAYVYFNKTDQEAQSVSALLRSLTAQFLRQTTYTHQALLHIYNESYENKKHVPFSTYVAAFRELMTVFAKTYIVIDAVNECWTKEKLLDFLQEIMGWQLPSNHVLITSRAPTQRLIRLRMGTLMAHQIPMDSSAVEEDIKLYVNATIRSDPRLRNYDGEVQQKIHYKTVVGAKGMFLWAYLWTTVVKRCNDADAVLMSLNQPLRKIDGFYEDLLLSIDESHVLRASKIFRFLAASGCEMQVREVAGLFAVDTSREQTTEVRTFSLLEELLTLCPLLNISIHQSDEVFWAVGFIHPSVSEFLTSERIKDGLAARFSFSMTEAYNFMAKTCLEFLFQTEDKGPSNIKNSPAGVYAAVIWPSHARASEVNGILGHHLEHLIMKALRMPWFLSLYDHDVGLHFDHLPLPETPGSPLYYSALWGLLGPIKSLIAEGADITEKCGHLGNALLAAAFEGHYSVVQFLLETSVYDLVERNRAFLIAIKRWDKDLLLLLLQHGADVAVKEKGSAPALQEAAAKGDLEIVNRLLAAGADVNTSAEYGITALQAAAEGGHLDIVNHLLSAGADVNTAVAEIGGRTALQAAAEGGHLDIVNQLLAAGADVNTAAAEEDGRTALQAAAERGHFETVNQLLKAGADINAPAAKSGGGTALHLAVLHDHLTVTKTLLSYGAIRNARGERDETALHLAVTRASDDMVRLLLQNGADVNAKQINGSSALRVAVQYDSLTIAKILLDDGANINARGERGETALHAAVQNGLDDIVCLLLQYGADVNAKDAHGSSALGLAVVCRRLKIAKDLLSYGADVNDQKEKGETALHAAVRSRSDDMVRLLLQSGADVNTKKGDGNSPLQIAAHNGKLEIVKILLDMGADVNAQGRMQGINALHEALLCRHDDVVRLLLQKGADVNARKENGLTALQIAASSGNLEIVRSLLESGADVNAPGGHWGMALQAAKDSKHEEVVQLLLEHGANPDDTEERHGITLLTPKQVDSPDLIEKSYNSDSEQV